MKKIGIMLCIGIVLFTGIKKVKSTNYVIPNEAIRLRVIANSDSSDDQLVKFQVSDAVQEKIYQLLKNTKSIDEARTIMNANLELLDQEVSSVLKKEKYPFSYELDYGLHEFPEKTYNGVTYKAGFYESLVVTLGEGKGNNWWCVLFPPLCLMEAEESDDVEYKFLVQELIEKYL